MATSSWHGRLSGNKSNSINMRFPSHLLIWTAVIAWQGWHKIRHKGKSAPLDEHVSASFAFFFHPDPEAELAKGTASCESRRHDLARICLLLLLQPFRAFDDRVPSVYKRDHETIHAKVRGSAVVNGRPVAAVRPRLSLIWYPRVNPKPRLLSFSPATPLMVALPPVYQAPSSAPRSFR